MPSTRPYVPSFDFASDPAPQNLVNARALQEQLNLISANIADLIQALGLPIRDDDTLSDEIVRLRNLHTELRTYIDSAITGTVATQALSYKLPVRVVSASNIAALSGPKTIDGVSCIAGDRVLLVGQTDASENGLWILAAGVWSRADDLPSLASSGAGWAVITQEGTTYGQTVWVILAGGDELDQPVVGSDDLTFFQVFGPFPLPIVKGGTGATTAAGARAALGAITKYVGSVVGTPPVQTYTITHNLNTVDVTVQVRDSAGRRIEVDDTAINVNQASLTFATAPTAGETYTVIVVG